MEMLFVPYCEDISHWSPPIKCDTYEKGTDLGVVLPNHFLASSDCLGLENIGYVMFDLQHHETEQ